SSRRFATRPSLRPSALIRSWGPFAGPGGLTSIQACCTRSLRERRCQALKKQREPTRWYGLGYSTGTLMKSPMCCFIPFISVFYIAGFAMLGFSLWSARRSIQAATWPTAPGSVTSVSVEDKSDDEGTTHEVKVEYRYSVDKVEYHGTRLAFGYSGSSGRAAHD